MILLQLRKLLSGLLLVLTTPLLQAQQQLNLGFEKLSTEGVARPWGWAVQYYSSNYQFECDSLNSRSGQYSLRIEGLEPKVTEIHELVFIVEPSQILNEAITLKGWIKGDNFKGIIRPILSSIGSTGEVYGELNSNLVELKPGADWQDFELNLKVHPNSHSIYIVLHTEGFGALWVDDLSLQVNGKEVKAVEVAPAIKAKDLKELGKLTSALKTFEPYTEAGPETGSFEDLQAIKAMVGDARLIALGEATHGTSEFFKVKHRLLQYAVEELGVRVFILEDNQLRTEPINNFVLYGHSDAETVIRTLFAVWNTEEMLAMIKWVRAYNLAHPEDMVSFVGMDIQNPDLAFFEVYNFLASKDSVLLAKSEALLQPIEDKRLSGEQLDYNLDLAVNDFPTLQNLQMMEKMEGQWLAEAQNEKDSNKVIWALQCARLINQYVHFNTEWTRDEYMADNVMWIINTRYPGKRAVLWAHDSHISNGMAKSKESNYFLGESMGSFLQEKLADDYKALGLFTYQGQCLGTISYSNFKRISFDIYTSPGGSLDQALHEIAKTNGHPNLFLNLQKVKDNPDKYSWLQQPLPARYVGYVAEDYGFGGRYELAKQFDGIIFIDTTTAAKPFR